MKKQIALFLAVALLLLSSLQANAAIIDGDDPLYEIGRPSISSISAASNSVVAKESCNVTVNVAFVPSTTISSVSCTIKIFVVDGTTATQIGSTQVLISESTAVSVPIICPTVGSVTLRAELYVSSTCLDARERTVTVMGRWRITIQLFYDRTKEGTLRLYDGAGNLKLTARCIGRSVSGDSMYVTYGNTPTGEYTGYLSGPHADTTAYGPHKYIAMTGVSGAIVQSERSGIWIHGGRNSSSTATDYTLSATYGCVRVTNGHQLQLQNEITGMINDGYHFATGRITITES